MLEDFNKEAEQCIDALNILLQSEYICMNDKFIMRINRFKRWVIEISADAQPESNNSNNN